MTARKYEDINLLPQRGLDSGVAGRLLAWILSSFRIIVIVTELIVMAAFLSRFFLDAKNSDLSEEIKQKETVLTAFSEFENNFRGVQDRLKIYNDLISYPVRSDILTSVTTSLPKDIFLNSIVITGGSCEISGFSLSENSAHQLLVNLRSRPLFSEVNVTELVQNNLESPYYKFKLQGKMLSVKDEKKGEKS